MPALSATIATSATSTVGGTWTVQPLLRCDSLSLRVFPEVSVAVVSQHYGWITEGSVAGQVLPIDLRGLFVRIALTDGTTTITWYGYCPGGSDAARKTYLDPATGLVTVPNGMLTWTIVGYEHFLRSMTLQGSYVPSGFLRRVLPFNVRRGRGQQIVGNRAAVADDGGVVPELAGCYRFDPTATDLWTANQAIAHILAIATIDTGIDWVFGGQTAELDLVDGAWDCGEAPTYADAIRAIANPELGWALVVNGANITVLSISDVAVGDLPANPNVVSLDVENATGMDVPRVNYLDQAHYSTITVRGEPLRVMFTLSVADDTLTPDWDATLETPYQAEVTDAGRRQDQYKYLWSRFRIPDDWDGTVPKVGGGTRPAFPAIVPATGGPHASDGQAVWARDIILDRSTPPLDMDADAQPGEPLVFVNDALGMPVRLDEPADDQPGARSIGVCDDRAGIIVRAPYRHFLAANLGTPYSGGGKAPLYEYASLQATVSAYTNDRVRISVAALVAEPGAVEREKIIDIPGLHLWLILGGTMTDVDTYETSDRVLRDDRDTLERVAALARVWYGRSRASIAVTYRDPLVLDRLGQVISEVRSTGAISPAGTMLTDITYSLTGPQTTSFATELFDLNFARMYGGNRTTREHHSRLSRIEEELANVPVRQGVGDAVGGGGSLLRITGLHSDSPASGVRMYVGDIYVNGTESAATSTNVTVRIPDIAADVTLPSSGDWDDVPACIGIRTMETWTGDSETHENDTVYAAVGLLLIW